VCGVHDTRNPAFDKGGRGNEKDLVFEQSKKQKISVDVLI
jgi:hypothetical protein